jgi:hypothetical protein
MEKILRELEGSAICYHLHNFDHYAKEHRDIQTLVEQNKTIISHLLQRIDTLEHKLYTQNIYIKSLEDE